MKWDVELTKVEEDDYLFDASDYLFKLLGLILSDQLTKDPKANLDKFISSLPELDKVIKAKRDKIEDADELWNNMKDELGSEHSKVIIPILKGE